MNKYATSAEKTCQISYQADEKISLSITVALIFNTSGTVLTNLIHYRIYQSTLISFKSI
jgi:hypothetical protein